MKERLPEAFNLLPVHIAYIISVFAHGALRNTVVEGAGEMAQREVLKGMGHSSAGSTCPVLRMNIQRGTLVCNPCV